MKILLDTNLLLRMVAFPDRISREVRLFLENHENILVFSAASLWEIVIKQNLGRPDFKVDARVLRRNLLDHGYQEMNIQSSHILAITFLPQIHKDPFDRILLAQAITEGITLFTSDATVSKYPGPVRRVV